MSLDPALCADGCGNPAVRERPTVGETRTRLRGFEVFGTGDPVIPEHMTYVGTGMFADGCFVFHVYEVSYA